MSPQLKTALAWTAAACLAASLLATSHAYATATATTATQTCTRHDAGRVLSVTPLLRLTSTEVAAELNEVGLPASARYGIEAHRIAYCTPSPRGRMTSASGLFVLPQTRAGRLPVVAYEHGTVSQKQGAPSFLTETEGRLVPFFFASDGFAVAAPDYVGLGLSPGHHPYLHAKSEASATVDLLRAVDTVAHRMNVRLDRQLFVSGHSQGGHATMASGRALQNDPGPWRLAALAPMAGPYDLSGAESEAILDPDRTEPHRASAYLAYMFTAWKDLYGLYVDPHEIYTDQYAGMVEDLFDGAHDFDVVDAALPLPEELFRPETLERIARPTGTWAAALRDNDVCRWAPRVPTRLYHSHGDRGVVFANAEQCLQQIRARGGRARIIDQGDVDHIGTAISSLPQIRTWFTSMIR